MLCCTLAPLASSFPASVSNPRLRNSQPRIMCAGSAEHAPCRSPVRSPRETTAGRPGRSPPYPPSKPAIANAGNISLTVTLQPIYLYRIPRNETSLCHVCDATLRQPPSCTTCVNIYVRWCILEPALLSVLVFPPGIIVQPQFEAENNTKHTSRDFII